MRRALLTTVLLGALLLSGRAAAADPTEFTGRMVRHVELELDRGGAARQLRYLIEQEAGTVYNPQAVRRSIELLFRLGQFDDVRAAVTPNEDGSVDLVFGLTASPRIGQIRLPGVRRLRASALRAALEKGRGDPYAPGDEGRAAQEAERYYRARGFLDAIVTGAVASRPGRARVLRLQVEEGPRYRIADVRFLGDDLGFTPKRLQSLLGPGVVPGRFYEEAVLADGLERLLDQLRKLGFVEARLLGLPGPRRRSRVPVEVRKDADTETVSLGIPLEAGHLVEAWFAFEGTRRPAWTQRRLQDVVGLNTSSRVSRTYAEDAARQLERFLWRRGFFHARVVVDVVDEPLALAGVPDWARPQVDSVRVLRFAADTGPEVTLRAADITTTGNEFLSRPRLISVLGDGSPEVIGHRPPLFVVLGFDIYRRYFTSGELDLAIDVLKDWYRARGYLSARATPSVRFVDRSCRETESVEEGRRVCLDLAIHEGPRTTVESLLIDPSIEELLAGAEEGEPGLDAPRRSPVDQWRRRFEGRSFNPARLDALIQEVSDALGEEGYVDARVQGRRELSTDGTLARLAVDVVPGSKVRFGKVVVRESRHTQVGFIRRQVPIRPGTLFRRSALQAAQGRLLRTGLFDGVVLRSAQAAGRLRDVEVLVNERKRFSFVLGAGVTAPDDGPRVSGETRLRNLDGRGLSMWARGRISVDWRSITLGFLLPEYRASLGMELPYLPGLPVRASLTALINEELDEPTYRISRSGAALNVGWRPSNRLTINAKVELQLRAPIRVDPVARLNALADIPTENPRQNPKLLALGSLSAVLDLRDDRLNPTRGVYVSATLETTPGAVVPGAPAFGRLTSRGVGLIPLGDRGFALQLELGGGVAWTYDGRMAPVEWRFRLGGTSTVRGFRLDTIGPTGTRAGTLETEGLLGNGFPTRSVPVGGNTYYRYAVQLQVPLPGVNGWRLTFFHDAGNALIYGKVPDGIDSGARPVLQTSIGLGLRRITPIGPLRLEFACQPGGLATLFRAQRAFADTCQVHFAVGAL